MACAVEALLIGDSDRCGLHYKRLDYIDRELVDPPYNNTNRGKGKRRMSDESVDGDQNSTFEVDIEDHQLPTVHSFRRIRLMRRKREESINRDHNAKRLRLLEREVTHDCNISLPPRRPIVEEFQTYESYLTTRHGDARPQPIASLYNLSHGLNPSDGYQPIQEHEQRIERHNQPHLSRLEAFKWARCHGLADIEPIHGPNGSSDSLPSRNSSSSPPSEAKIQCGICKKWIKGKAGLR